MPRTAQQGLTQADVRKIRKQIRELEAQGRFDEAVSIEESLQEAIKLTAAFGKDLRETTGLSNKEVTQLLEKRARQRLRRERQLPGGPARAV